MADPGRGTYGNSYGLRGDDSGAHGEFNARKSIPEINMITAKML